MATESVGTGMDTASGAARSLAERALLIALLSRRIDEPAGLVPLLVLGQIRAFPDQGLLSLPNLDADALRELESLFDVARNVLEEMGGQS